MFCRPTLNDTERLRTLINVLASDLSMSVSHSGHVYAMAQAASSLSPAAHLSEEFGGLSQVLIAHINAPTCKHFGLIAVTIRP